MVFNSRNRTVQVTVLVLHSPVISVFVPINDKLHVYYIYIYFQSLFGSGIPQNFMLKTNKEHISFGLT